MNRLTEIQTWYAAHCNGEWEHSYGVKIDTLDNPGWSVKIELTDTELEDADFEPHIEDRSESDWIHCKVKERIFEGAGDASKFETILTVFLDWARQHEIRAAR